MSRINYCHNDIRGVSYPVIGDLPLLRKVASVMAKQLQTAVMDHGYTSVHFVFTGTSGAVCASELHREFTAIDFTPVMMVQIYKKGESSHRSPVEQHGFSRSVTPFTGPVETRVSIDDRPLRIFVDDFIASGETLNGVLSEMRIREAHITGIAVWGDVHLWTNIYDHDDRKKIKVVIGRSLKTGYVPQGDGLNFESLPF
jgi:hypothetical protein